jgi:hypothetical protein
MCNLPQLQLSHAATLLHLNSPAVFFYQGADSAMLCIRMCLQEDRQLELEARIAAKTEQLLALERKVQALEALQEKQLKAAAVLKQLRLIDSKANKPQVGQPEQWMQQSWAHKSVSSRIAVRLSYTAW